MTDINGNQLWQVLWQGARFDFEQNVFEDTTAGLDASRLADGFNRDHHGDFLVLGHFVEIHMQHLSAERMMLDLLHQCQAFGTRVVLHCEIYQEVLGDGMMNQILHFLGADFQILRLGLATVNHGRDTPEAAQFFSAGAPRQRSRKCIECYRFHVW